MLHVCSLTPDDPAIGTLHTPGENVAPGWAEGGGSSRVAAESPQHVNHLQPSLQRTRGCHLPPPCRVTTRFTVTRRHPIRRLCRFCLKRRTWNGWDRWNSGADRRGAGLERFAPGHLQVDLRIAGVGTQNLRIFIVSF